MPEPIDLAYAFSLTPRAALAYFKSKGLKVSWNAEQLWGVANDYAFTVAKVTSLDVLQSIRDEITKAIETGMSLDEFKIELNSTLQSLGWETRADGTAWRLDNIYRTNLQSAYNAGRLQEAYKNIAQRPFWQYVSVIDSRTTDHCREMNGKIFPLGEYDFLQPPAHYQCRARARFLSEKNISDRDLNVLRPEIIQKEELLSQKSGATVQVKGIKLSSGNTLYPAPSFDYPPGQFEPNPQKYDPSIGRLL